MRLWEHKIKEKVLPTQIFIFRWTIALIRKKIIWSDAFWHTWTCSIAYITFLSSLTICIPEEQWGEIWLSIFYNDTCYFPQPPASIALQTAGYSHLLCTVLVSLQISLSSLSLSLSLSLSPLSLSHSLSLSLSSLPLSLSLLSLSLTLSLCGLAFITQSQQHSLPAYTKPLNNSF